MTAQLSVGSKFPSGVKFTYVPFSPESADVKACGSPIQLSLDSTLANKKVVIVAAPGAFTPACMNKHIPSFGEHFSELKSKGVDQIIVITANDAFVLSAWGKVLGLSDKIIFASDPNAAFSESVGLAFDGSAHGLGVRTQRYAAIVDNGVVKYLGVEKVPTDVNVSSAEAVLKAL